MIDKLALARMCLNCSESIYANVRPSRAYAEAIGRLLFGTACAESELKYRRQIAMPLDVHWGPCPTHDIFGCVECTMRGAWGLWQTELLAVYDSVKLLEVRPNLGTRCITWLEGHGVGRPWSIMNRDPLALMQFIGQCDPLACLFARLHYLRFPNAVPIDLSGQAREWKQHYNTVAGAGTVEGYLEKWRTIGAATWEDLVEHG